MNDLFLYLRKLFSFNEIITFVADMKKKDQTSKTREHIFAEKIDSYGICYSTICPLREHWSPVRWLRRRISVV